MFFSKDYPTQVIDKLWISGSTLSSDEKFIRANNIRTIINCTSEVPNTFKPFYLAKTNHNPFLEYHQINVPENPRSIHDFKTFYDSLLKLVPLVNYKLSSGSSVLIHCSDGNQRSATLVAAVMYYKYRKSHNCTMDQVVNHIKNIRRTAFLTKINYKQVLEEYIKIV